MWSMARNYLKDHRFALGVCFISVVLFLSSIFFIAFVQSSLRTYICPNSIDFLVKYTQSNTTEVEGRLLGGQRVDYLSSNLTLCDFIAQFEVFSSVKIVSVCVYQGKPRVDIREFYQGKPSIRGIWFTLNEWKNFV